MNSFIYMALHYIPLRLHELFYLKIRLKNSNFGILILQLPHEKKGRWKTSKQKYSNKILTIFNQLFNKCN